MSVPKAILFFVLISFTLFGLSCNFADKEKSVLKEYDLSKPEVFDMPVSLMEISGITFDQGKGDIFYAIQDEEGKLFRLSWQNQKQKHTKFAGRGDYEDVTILKNQVVVLKSNGSLFTFPFSETQLEETNKTKEWKRLLPKGEYEALFGDETTGKIYVLCKSCPTDNPEQKVSGFILNSVNTVEKTGGFSLDIAAFKSLGVKIKKGFQPSALAKNPLTGDWYILSSVNKTLVVLDRTWKAKEFYALSSNNFGQPEGIAFDKLGNLYISNEGDAMKVGNILKFKRQLK